MNIQGKFRENKPIAVGEQCFEDVIFTSKFPVLCTDWGASTYKVTCSGGIHKSKTLNDEKM